MKTYMDIRRELKEIQESRRHPKKDETGHVPSPKPEGEIAAISVQFLLGEVAGQVGRRDDALDAAEKAERAVVALVDILKVQGKPGADKLAMKEREIADLKEQITVNRCAALAMFQKLRAAAVMAKSGSAVQVAQYLDDAVNFHLNGAMREVQRLNAEQRKEEAQTSQSCVSSMWSGPSLEHLLHPRPVKLEGTDYWAQLRPSPDGGGWLADIMDVESQVMGQTAIVETRNAAIDAGRRLAEYIHAR